MVQEVKFTCTALEGTGHEGVFTPDSNGYYSIVIGGLNCFNSANAYYPYDTCRQLFEQSSSFMRRVQSACLKGEYGHPKMVPGQSQESFAQRVMSIDEKSVSHHFSEIWIDLNGVKDPRTNQPIVAVMGKVKPAGPYAAALEASLNNPKEDVCFSVRGFTDDSMRGGVRHRNLVDIITWDTVTEPGINAARKFKSPSLEAREERTFTKEQLEAAVSQDNGFALESAIVQTNQLFRALGWDMSHLSTPRFMTW